MGSAERIATGPRRVRLDLGKRSWLGVLKRTGKEFSADNLTDWAAALTYYGGALDLPRADRAGLDPRPGRRPSAHASRCIDNPRPRSRRAPAKEILTGADREPAAQPRRGRAAVRRRHRRARSGRRRATSARSCAPRTRSTRSRRAARSGSTRRSSCSVTLVLIAAARSSSASPSCSPAGSRPRSATPSGVGTTAVTVWDIAKWPVLAARRRADVRAPLLGRAERQASPASAG